jgi:hypothetical protein
LQKHFFFAGKEDVAINQIFGWNGTWVLILPQLRWSRVYLLLGIHHILVWNRVFQNGRRWLFQVLLSGLLRGRRCWRTLRVHGFFHPFEVRILGAMVSIMSILTTKSAREVCLEIVVFLPWSFVVVVPLGVLVAPNGMVLLGVISSWSQVIIVSVFTFLLGIIQLMGRIFRIQLFKILKLLNGRGLNKINADMWVSLWRSNKLGRIRKWKIWIVLGSRSIWFIRKLKYLHNYYSHM